MQLKPCVESCTPLLPEVKFWLVHYVGHWTWNPELNLGKLSGRLARWRGSEKHPSEGSRGPATRCKSNLKSLQDSKMARYWNGEIKNRSSGQSATIWKKNCLALKIAVWPWMLHPYANLMQSRPFSIIWSLLIRSKPDDRPDEKGLA